MTEIRELGSGAAWMGRIGRLRIVAWASRVPEAAAMGSWLDEHDAAARHWGAFRDGDLVGAARMTVHESLAGVPDAESYEGLFDGAPPRAVIASLNRLVVHPSARGAGLSKALDLVRLEEAERLGCCSALLATASGPGRVRQLAGLGFVQVGLGPRFLNAPLCHLPAPEVMLCKLPRERVRRCG